MKLLIIVWILLGIASLILFFQLRGKKNKPVPAPPGPEIRFVPIGDSYTIGQGVWSAQSWPQLLTDHLRAAGYNVRLVVNPAQSGWTTQDAIDKELPIFTDSKPHFATLLIGANDFVQGVDDGRFRDKLTYLIDHMLAVLPQQKELVLITIPDYSVTKMGRELGDPPVVHAGIMRFNAIIAEEGKKRGLPVVDMFSLSQRMATDSALVNSDNLHPSAKEYIEWEKLVYPEVVKMLQK